MLTPLLPPQAAPIYSGFDYVTVDAQRRRVYAAHTGSRALLVVDADSGKVVGQVRVGPMHGVAVNPANGHVFTGDGDDDKISEVDPVAMKEVRSLEVAGHVDAVAYDPSNQRIYADEDDGTRLFVVDATSFKLIKTVVLPGHKPEYLAVDPRTHAVYQNIADLAEIAVVDPRTLSVTRTIPTPDLKGNHPLQYDAELGEIVVGGTNGVMETFSTDGKKLAHITPGRFDQCDLDPTQHVLACAGDGGVTRVALDHGGGLRVLDTTPIAAGVHTDAIDPRTHHVFAVWSERDGSGDFVRAFRP